MEEFMTGQPPLDAEAGYLTSQLAAGEQPRIGVTLSTLTDDQDRSVRRTLPTVLGMRDLTLFMVLIVVFISNTNGVQFGADRFSLLGAWTDHLSRPLCARHPVVGAALSREVHALPVDWSHPGSQLELHLSLLHLADGRPDRRLRHR